MFTYKNANKWKKRFMRPPQKLGKKYKRALQPFEINYNTNKTRKIDNTPILDIKYQLGGGHEIDFDYVSDITSTGGNDSGF